MEIVERAYIQSMAGLPDNASFYRFNNLIKLNMVRLIKLRAYDRRDWPTRAFG